MRHTGQQGASRGPNAPHPFGSGGPHAKLLAVQPDMTEQAPRRVRVAGLGELHPNLLTMLEPFGDRIEIVQRSPDGRLDVDVLLYDSSAAATDVRPLIEALESVGPPRSRVREAWFGESEGLTPRESQIVTGIAAGRTNLQIAQDFHLTLNTVKTYIRTAYRKMGVVSRTQAVVWCLTHGLELPTPPVEQQN